MTVDHGLQEGSADRAAPVAAALGGLGLDPVRAVAVTVDGGGGPEAAARTARYAALEAAAADLGAAAVLLGHTLDDQAETVLLGLARGSGARSLAGMPPRRGVFLRPLLGLRRQVTAGACAALGLDPVGATRTTPTGGSPGSGSGLTRCPRSRPRSGRGWPRRWRAPPVSCGMMPRCWSKIAWVVG